MEPVNEPSSTTEPRTGNRPSRFSKLSSKNRSFWATASCLFHLNCFFQSVEEQTEEDVARFIAMSTEHARNNSAAAEKAGPGTLDSLSKTSFTDLLQKFNDTHATVDGQRSRTVSRPAEVEKGYVARRISFFSSLGHGEGIANDQECFSRASGNGKFSPFGETVSLQVVQATDADGGNGHARKSLEEGDMVSGRGTSEDKGEVARVEAKNSDRAVQTGPNEPDAKVRELVQDEPVDGAGTNRTELAGDTGFILVGSTSTTVEMPRIDGTTTTLRFDVMVQAEPGVAQATADEIEAVYEVTQCDGGSLPETVVTYGDNGGMRERGSGFLGIRKLFRRRWRQRDIQIISI